MRSAARSASLRSRFALDLLEQPRVLDGDHRLIGKGGHEFDLLRRERLHLVSREKDGADQCAFPQERHAEHLSLPSYALPVATREFRIRQHVFDMDRGALERDPARHAAPVDPDRVLHDIPEVLGIHPVGRDQAAYTLGAARDEGVIRYTEPRGRRHNCVEHRLHF